MIIIPNRETKNLKQSDRSNLLNQLWSTFNIDLQSNLGTIRVSPRMKLAESSATETNLGLPIVFRHFDNLIFTIASQRVFFSNTSGILSTGYTEDSSTGAKTNYDERYSDMELFNGSLYTTTVDELMKKASDGNATGAWSEIDSAFTSETTPHPLCYFKKHNRLYYADLDFIASIDTSDSVSSGDYEIDLNISWREVVTTMKASASSIFIGTIAPDTGTSNGDVRGAVYEWDGKSSDITRRYILESAGVVAMCIKNDIPYIIDTNGALLEYRGNSFVEIGRLPFKTTLPINNSTIGNTRFIHPNGFIPTKNNTFLVLVNNSLGDSSSSILENFPSGIWEWSANNGFVHKKSLSYTSDTTITDYGQNRLSQVGALMELNRYSTSASRNGQYLCGATYYTNASSTLNGIFYDDSNNTLQKYGYFVTSWLSSQALKDTWQKVAVKFRQLLDSEDKIVVKYRIREEAPVYIDITWNDTSSFHSTTDLTNYVGYEVEIIQGVGSGKCFHISSISGNNPWKANLDDVLTGATGTAKARLQNWKKVMTVANQTSESDVKTFPTVKSERIQVKVCLQFKGDDELHELIIINQTDTKLE